MSGRRYDWRRLLPRYWLQNEPTSWEWDDLLNEALDRYQPVAGYCTCQVGPLTVWASNWPYAYGNLYKPERKGLPTVATRLRLRRLLEAQDYSEARRALASEVSA